MQEELDAFDLTLGVFSGVVCYVLAPYLGLKIAQKSRSRFLLGLLFERLDGTDQQALLDLVHSTFAATPQVHTSETQVGSWDTVAGA